MHLLEHQWAASDTPVTFIVAVRRRLSAMMISRGATQRLIESPRNHALNELMAKGGRWISMHAIATSSLMTVVLTSALPSPSQYSEFVGVASAVLATSGSSANLPEGQVWKIQ